MDHKLRDLILKEDLENLESYLRANPSFDKKDSLGTSPSIFSIMEKKTRVFELLIKHGVVYIEDCLKTAAWTGQIELIDKIISKGAKDIDEALCVAAQAGKTEVVKYLISKHRADPKKASFQNSPLLSHAVLSNELALVKFLVEDMGVDVTLTDELNIKPTDLAQACGFKEISEYLYKTETGS